MHKSMGLKYEPSSEPIQVCTLEENKEQGWVTLKTPAGQVGTSCSLSSSLLSLHVLEGP